MLTPKQQLRYSRHFLLQEIGEQGQIKLHNSRVLVVGVGGLGCPAATYLAAAGVGRLILADGDQVELSNLQRQVLFQTADVGANKAEQAMQALQALNPEVEIEALDEHLDQDSLAYLVAQVDLVLDCSDNLATRHAVNAACLAQKVPLVTAAAIRFEGQLALFDFKDDNAPCYHCLYPASAGESGLNCANSGVAGPLLGVMGSLQALTALKYLLGLQHEPVNTLRLYDGLSGQWQSFRINKDPNCPVCAK